MYNSGIYCIEDANGRLYYGSAVDFENRWSSHKNALSGNYHGNPKLQNAWNKYGPDYFTFYSVELVTDKSKLLEREQVWLDFVFATEECHYNICPIAGSTKGRKHTDDTKDKISRSAKGRKSPNKGKSMSSESRLKMSAAKLGRTAFNKGVSRTEDERIRIALTRNGGKQYSLIGPDGTVYENIRIINEFAKIHNLCTSTLSKVLRGIKKQHKGFRLK